MVQHGHRRRPLPLLPQLARRSDASRTPSIGGPHPRARRRAATSSARPRSSRASATASPRATRGAPDEQRGAFQELLELSRTVFPYVEEHKFYCDYWYLTSWYNKVREFGALLAEHGYLEDAEDVFQLSRHEVMQALEELVLHWAAGGLPLGPTHWPPIVAAAQGAAREARRLDAAAGARHDARGATNDPITVMLWGITRERLQEWARAQDGGDRAARLAGGAGRGRGAARVVKSVDQIADVRDGEILVCGHVAGVGADLQPDHRDGDRHRRHHVPRGDRLPRVRHARRRRDRPRDGADPHRPAHPRRRRRRARSRSSTATGRPRDGRPHAVRSTTCAPPTRRGSAARARASASCSRRGCRCRRGSRCRRRAFHAFLAGGLEGRMARRSPACARTTWERAGGGGDDPRRGLRDRVPEDVRAEIAERYADGSASRRSRCARARSARTAPRRRSPASRRPSSGSAAPTPCATRCATAGRARTARRR